MNDKQVTSLLSLVDYVNRNLDTVDDEVLREFLKMSSNKLKQKVGVEVAKKARKVF